MTIGVLLMRIWSCIVIVVVVVCYRYRVCAKLEKHVRDNGVELCIYRRRRATPLGGTTARRGCIRSESKTVYARVRTHNRAMLEI